MVPRIFNTKDGLNSVDFVHCGLDHITASRLLFESDASHYDSAGYLAHIGIELLLKGWLLEVSGQFAGIHIIEVLYSQLKTDFGAPKLTHKQIDVVKLLDGYEKLRYPNLNQPIQIGADDWNDIELFVGFICRSMPHKIPAGLENIEFGHKSGRVLMQKQIKGSIH